tara:strand:- start:961 stop:1995 length:1035 start_codon:yes stop_codon:yes gene_type:complete
LLIGIFLWNLKEVIIQIFAAIVLAVALCTLVGKFRESIPVARSWALMICLSLLFTIFGLIIVLVLPPFSEQFQELILQLPKAAIALWELSKSSFESFIEFIYGNNQAEKWGGTFLINEFNPFPDGTTITTGVADGIKNILSFASNLSIGLVQLIFVLTVSLMIAIQPERYKEGFILLIPSFYRRRSREVLNNCGDALGNWMFGVLISSVCVALLSGFFLSILGVKLVVANALLAGLLNIIPNVGPVISTIFPLSVALLDSPWRAVAVLGSYIFIQNLESYLITPSIMHHQVKMLPGVTLAAQFTFTIIFGPIGLLLALPLTVVMQVLIRDILVNDLLDNWEKNK